MGADNNSNGHPGTVKASKIIHPLQRKNESAVSISDTTQDNGTKTQGTTGSKTVAANGNGNSKGKIHIQIDIQVGG